VADSHDLLAFLICRVTPADEHIGAILTKWLLKITHRVVVEVLLQLLAILKYRKCGEELKRLFYMFDELEDFGPPQYREVRRRSFRTQVLSMIIRTRQPGLEDWLEQVATDPEVGTEKAELIGCLDRFLPHGRALEICREQLSAMPVHACKIIGRRGTREDIATIDRILADLSPDRLAYKVLVWKGGIMKIGERELELVDLSPDMPDYKYIKKCLLAAREKLVKRFSSPEV
jgi:hypothetical protein